MKHVGALVIGLLLIASACGADSTSAPDEREATSDSRSNVDVILTAGGTADTIDLRIAPQAGDVSSATMAMSLTTEITESAVEPMPITVDITLDFTTVVDAVADNGDVTYSFAYGESAIADSSGMEPGAIAAINQSLLALNGAGGGVTTTERGLPLDVELNLGDQIDPTVEAFLDQLETQITTISAPFPEEAVGVGAKWEATWPLELGSIDTTTTYRYELISFDGANYELAVSFIQDVEPQELDDPSLPAGVTVRIEQQNTSGSGTVSGSTTQILPISSSIEAETIQTIVTSLEDNSERTTTHISLTATVESTAG